MLYACTRQTEARECPVPLTIQYLQRKDWSGGWDVHRAQAYASRGFHIRKDLPTRVGCYPYGRPSSQAAAVGGRLRPVASARRSDKRRALVTTGPGAGPGRIAGYRQHACAGHPQPSSGKNAESGSGSSSAAYRAERGKPQPSAEALNNLWNEWKNPADAVRQLDLARLPADALAFYRPFHFSPHLEWGIYILVEPLLHHCAILYDSCRRSISVRFQSTRPRRARRQLPPTRWLFRLLFQSTRPRGARHCGAFVYT
jgi:hypothetical protein